MNLKYVKTEGNSEVYQYAGVDDYMELIEHYSLILGRLSEINITEYKENEKISDQSYESFEMLKQKCHTVPSDFQGYITISSADRNKSAMINTVKKTICLWEKERTVEYSMRESEKTIFRIQSFSDFKMWNKETHTWDICPHRSTFYDISGRGGNWYNYTDISRAKAWQFVKENGGTWEEFTCEEAEKRNKTKDKQDQLSGVVCGIISNVRELKKELKDREITPLEKGMLLAYIQTLDTIKNQFIEEDGDIYLTTINDINLESLL